MHRSYGYRHLPLSCPRSGNQELDRRIFEAALICPVDDFADGAKPEGLSSKEVFPVPLEELSQKI